MVGEHQVALVLFAYVLVLTFCHLVISGVRSSCCLCLWCVRFASLCASTPGRLVLSGRNLGIERNLESCGIGSAMGCRQKPEGSCSQLILCSCVLMALSGALLGHEFEEKSWS